MTARGRALAILTGLAVFVAGWVMFVSRWSGPAGAGPDGRGAVAGKHAADLDAIDEAFGTAIDKPDGFVKATVTP